MIVAYAYFTFFPLILGGISTGYKRFVIRVQVQIICKLLFKLIGYFIFIIFSIAIMVLIEPCYLMELCYYMAKDNYIILLPGSSIVGLLLLHITWCRYNFYIDRLSKLIMDQELVERQLDVIKVCRMLFSDYVMWT